MLVALTMGGGILLIPRLRDSAMRILAFFFLLFGYILFCPIVINADLSYIPKFIEDFCSLLFFVALLAIPSTVYYYVYELSIKNKHKKLDLVKLYFFPIGLFIINTIAFIALKKLPDDSDSFYFTVIQDVMEYSNFIAILFLFPLLSIFYIYISFRRYSSNKKKIAANYSYEEELNLNWIWSFIIGYAVFIGVVYFLQISSLSSLNPWIGLLMLIYLFLIGYKGYRQVGFNAEMMYEQETETVAVVEQPSVLEATILKSKVSPKNEQPLSQPVVLEEELISDSIRSKLKADLLNCMDQKRPFLEQKLTVSQLAKLINTNSKYLSYVLNNDFEQNFVSFINSYRVEEAKKYLQSEEYSHIKIEAIGNMAGFRSKSSFNNAFKSMTAETPSAFRKRIKKIDS